MNKLITILILISAIILGLYGNLNVKSIFYSISILSKDIIMFWLPIMVIMLMLDAFLSMKTNNLLLISIIMFTIFCSNFLATNIAFFVSKVFNSNIKSVNTITISDSIEAYHLIKIKPLFNPISAIILAILINIIINTFYKTKIDYIHKIIKKLSIILMKYVVSPLLPILISGFIIKICNDKIFFSLLNTYYKTFIIILLSSYGYILFWYLILLGKKKFLPSIKEFITPVFIGMVTMSSSLSMPSIIQSLNKVLGKNKIVQVVIPPAINFHLIGDAFAIPILALSIIYTSTGIVYSYEDFFILAIFLVISKFAVVTIPGGAILVLSGVLETKFGFNESMIILITTIYMVFDFVTTSANVFSNGALTILIDKIYNKIDQKLKKPKI